MSHDLILRPGATVWPVVRLASDYLRAQEYFEAIITSTTDAIVAANAAGRIIYFSPGAEAMLGLSSLGACGKPVHELYQGGREQALRIMGRLRREGRIQDHEMVFTSKDGRAIHVSMSASLLKDRAGHVIGTLGIAKDITRRVELETRLRDLAITDDLTGLYNKRHFHERLTQEVSRARRLRQKFSLLLIDLDAFKTFNDRLGHPAGDKILREFSSLLHASIRKEVDSAYRYGGDEFVILLPGLGLKRARDVAARIEAAAHRRQTERTHFSWGAATLTANVGTATELLRLADRRMFTMKAAHKHRA